MRTYTRPDLDAARAAWADYGHEWSAIRAIMGERTIFPPAGDSFDDRDDPEPSQRAIIWRSLDYRRESTLDLARHSKSWPELVGRILAAEGRLREDVALRERDTDWDRQFESSDREATKTLKQIIDRIGAS